MSWDVNFGIALICKIVVSIKPNHFKSYPRPAYKCISCCILFISVLHFLKFRDFQKCGRPKHHSVRYRIRDRDSVRIRYRILPDSVTAFWFGTEFAPDVGFGRPNPDRRRPDSVPNSDRIQTEFGTELHSLQRSWVAIAKSEFALDFNWIR